MPRAIWKGAISFGLVHVPVGLYPASREEEIDFDWLDKRSMDPVGYKRVNKRTGREVSKDNIVRGVEQATGEYVVVTDEDVRNAYPKTTQTINIEGFVEAQDIPFVFLERPYYLAPLAKAEKVYALLREAMLASGRVAIARVVMQNKQHLAAVIPTDTTLILNILRWPSEIRPLDEIELPPTGKKSGLKPAELKMASQLISEMSAKWDPSSYADNFKEAIMALVKRKAKAGDTESVQPFETAEEARPSNVIDVTELLKRSLKRGGAKAPAKRAHASSTKAKKKVAAARKSA